MKTEKVEGLLMDYYHGNLSRREAIEKLTPCEPLDLYMAELELMDKGLQKGDIAEISDIYIDLIERDVDEIFSSLEKEHPVRIFIGEHQKIKGMLRTLEDMMNQEVLIENKQKFRVIVGNLEEFKKHIQREERTIFDKMKEREPGGRVLLLSEDHDDFKEQIDKIESLLSGWETNIDEIKKGSKNLIYTLRMHHFLEDDLFYPVALELIDEWEEIKKENERMGYCDFEPI